MALVPEILKEVLIAVAIGGLIGSERENEPERKFAGLRTLALLCGVAPAFVLLAEMTGSVMFVLLYLSLAILLAMAVLAIRMDVAEESIGVTTSVAVVVVAVLGVLVGYNMYFEATSIVLIATFLLAQKERMHDYVNQLTDEEISDALVLGMLVFVLLPILPNHAVGPYSAVNPQKVLLLAIFVLLIQFVAFVSMRQIGHSRGLFVTGLLGGMANSFATAGVLARLSQDEPETYHVAASSFMLATISMILRNTAIATVLAASIFSVLFYPVAGMLAVAILFAVYLKHGETFEEELDTPIESPFSYVAAAKFALVFIGISVASSLAEVFVGDVGLYATAFIGGLVSSTAVATSAATLLSQGSAGLEVASGMVLLSMGASITSKIVLVELINKELRWYVTFPLLVILVSGLAVFVVL
ncbi:MAG: MgtC/SapB family protein [Candidatus Nanohaloarchaea archaeon]|nr:MgtC/SapB family protein [Candidatus Nanohaloarchaea archaeon]